MANLVSIAGFAQQVSDAIAAVLGLDVEIVDDNLVRIAGTGRYVAHIGKSLEMEGEAYRRVLETGADHLVSEPGLDEPCLECPGRRSCAAKARVSVPINVQGKTIGIIGLHCFDDVQRSRLLSRLATHRGFAARMADLVASRVRERAVSEAERSGSQFAAMLLNHVTYPVAAIDVSEELVYYNACAKELLVPWNSGMTSRTDLLKVLKTAFRGRKPVKDKELFLDSGDGEKPYLVSVDLLKSADGFLGAMASIRPAAELQQWATELVCATRDFTFDDIVFQSHAMGDLVTRARQVASNPSTVLIVGETGTGKELIARAIHQASNRANRPMVSVNCAAIPDDLLESELFGYEAGAFMGTLKGGKPGKFEIASGGTLLLDEVGDMPLHLQTKILRVLRMREVERLGGTRARPVDVRIIATTNEDLRDKAERKQFKEDLFFRLSVVGLKVPALRERREDIALLANHFVLKHSMLLGRDCAGLSPEASQILEAYDWPGNVRELEHAIEYATNIEGSVMLQVHSFPEYLRSPNPAVNRLAGRTIAAVEEALVRDALRRHSKTRKGKEAAAKELGISVATLYRKAKAYGADSLE